MPADVEEEEVGDDDEQCRDADDKLDEQFRSFCEVSLDYAQSRCDGCPRHNGQERHRQNGVCQLLVYYTHDFYCYELIIKHL